MSWVEFSQLPFWEIGSEALHQLQSIGCGSLTRRQQRSTKCRGFVSGERKLKRNREGEFDRGFVSIRLYSGVRPQIQDTECCEPTDPVCPASSALPNIGDYDALPSVMHCPLCTAICCTLPSQHHYQWCQFTHRCADQCVPCDATRGSSLSDTTTLLLHYILLHSHAHTFAALVAAPGYFLTAHHLLHSLNTLTDVLICCSIHPMPY